MKINCIIVDDEPASREILEKYVENCFNLTLIKTCKNAFEASDIIHEQKIDLIFLDINMPKLSGIKFYKSLVNPPNVIFTTAYPEFAVEGFEVNAIDYLLKPFSFERFLKAVNKTIGIIKGEPAAFSDYILLKSEKKIYRVNINDIIHLEAVGDYVQVNFGKKSILVHDRLQNLLALLPDNHFIRVHKSHVISVDKFDIIEGNMVKIKDKTIPIGATYRNDFLNFITNREMK